MSLPRLTLSGGAICPSQVLELCHLIVGTACLPLMREVAKPQVLPEGEKLSGIIGSAFSLPQSAALTAPS